MMFTNAAPLLLALLSTVSAHPASQAAAADDPRFTQWARPGPNDIRGPCPGLNSLANHGFINRDGRDLTLEQVRAGSKAGLNIGDDFTLAIFTAGVLSSPDPLAVTFNLDDLARHNFPIEHDVSLSREDAALGSQKDFNTRAYTQFMSLYANQEYTSIPVAAKAKITRFNDQKARNPQFTYGAREFVFSYGETGLYLQTMSNSTTSGIARVEYVKSLFEEERLPYHLGWRPNPSPITLVSLGSMIPPLFLASGETAPEGLQVVKDSYKNLFQPIGPLGALLQSAALRLGVPLPI